MRIGAGDEMYAYEHTGLRPPGAAAVAYFLMGQQIFRTVEELVGWKCGGFGGVRAFLDFASGFGRLTRFLVRALPPERLTVAEIDPAAVRFQERTFGVRGIVSTMDPEAFDASAGAFDLILASSFFSHMPRPRFEDWLRTLFSRLHANGALAFSVHGMDLVEDSAVDRSSGFVFWPTSETARLDKAEYGSAFVTEGEVRAIVAGVTAGEGRLFFAPRAFGGGQDLYVLTRAKTPELAPPRFACAPRGELASAAITDGTVSAEGWALGPEDEGPPAVKLFLRDRPVPVTLDARAASPAVRWRLEFPLDAVAPDDLVRIEAESQQGRRALLYVGSLRPYLERADRSD